MHTPQLEQNGSSGSAFQGVTRYHWMVVIIASCGWLFDCMDQRLFILAREPALTQLLDARGVLVDPKTIIGYATTAMMIGWATGGILFGMMSDRWGRVKTMAATLLIYAGFTGLSGCATSWFDFVLYRFLVGLGVGGMFGAATTLVAESVPGRFRSLALGSLQALSALGNIIGSLLSLGIKPNAASLFGLPGWRVLFFVGILPSLLVVPIIFLLKEPEVWRQAVRQGTTHRKAGSYAELLANPYWHISAAVAGAAGIVLIVLTMGLTVARDALPTALATHQIPLTVLLVLVLVAAGIWTLAGSRVGSWTAVGLIVATFLGLWCCGPAEWPRMTLSIVLGVLLVVAHGLGSIGRYLGHADYDLRWRRNAVVGLFIGLAGMAGLWGIGFFSPELITTALKGQPPEVIDSARGLATALQDVGAFLGMMAFTLVATYVGRRLAFFVSFILCLVVTIYVFNNLHTRTDAYWMLPMMGFAQLSVFGGYSIYFPELFPTRLRGTGVGFCYNTVRYLAAGFPPMLMSLNSWLVAEGVDEPFRKAATAMSFIFATGLVVLIWAPETKGQPLPED